MAAKKRRKRTSNPKKRAHKRRKHTRSVAANPKRAHKRRRRSNPRPTSRVARRAHSASHRRARRAHRANPSRSRRRRRHNPVPVWALAGLAAAAGLAAYAIGQAGTFAITQRTADAGKQKDAIDRNRYIAFGVLTAAGLGLAAFVKSPALQMVGAGLASGGLVGLAGTELSGALSSVIDKKDEKGNTIPLSGMYDAPQFAGVYAGGQQQFASVYDGGQQQFGAVFDDGHQDFAG